MYIHGKSYICMFMGITTYYMYIHGKSYMYVHGNNFILYVYSWKIIRMFMGITTYYMYIHGKSYMYVHGNNYVLYVYSWEIICMFMGITICQDWVWTSCCWWWLGSDTEWRLYLPAPRLFGWHHVSHPLTPWQSSILTRLISVLQQHINITCLYSSQVHVDCQNISISWKMYLVFFFIFFYTDRLQNAEDWSVAFLVHTGLFWCFHNTPNSDKDYTIFSLRIQSFHHVYYARGPSIQFNLIQFNSI